jgi:putative membrane protein
MDYVSSAGIFGFAVYMAIGILMLAIFMWTYMRITPHNDWEAIKTDRLGPTLAMVGAAIGFTLPIVSVSLYGINLLDFMIWSLIAGAVQLTLFKILYWLLPQTNDADNVAAGVFYAGAAICIGMLNAVSLVPG